jgi:hypothetical protein
MMWARSTQAKEDTMRITMEAAGRIAAIHNVSAPHNGGKHAFGIDGRGGEWYSDGARPQAAIVIPAGGRLSPIDVLRLLADEEAHPEPYREDIPTVENMLTPEQQATLAEHDDWQLLYGDEETGNVVVTDGENHHVLSPTGHVPAHA